MNERIKELAEQADMFALRDEDGNPQAYYLIGNSIEKFAELIVRECIDVVDVGGEFVSRPKMVERLKQHFGVEE